MKTNTASNRPVLRTHEGAPARRTSKYDQLRRSILSCLLFEREFYEDGVDISERIKALVKDCDPKQVSDLAHEARTRFHLRHAPLLLARELARNTNGRIIGDTIAGVIQRADEIAEFLAIYWKDGRQPLSAQVKKGLARAFHKFDEYQLAKYDRDGTVKLRDALFLCHAKPVTKGQEDMWKRLVDGELKTPDTWETNLSAGEDKKETFERLLKDGKLGYMALLRNLRNMRESGVDESLVFNALIEGADKSKALPFRYFAAAKAVPQWEPAIDQAMLASLDAMDTLPGKTLVLVDVSASMGGPLSGKSTLGRMDAGCALAALVAGIADSYLVYSFSMQLVAVPPRQGMALADAIQNSQDNSGTYLGAAIQKLDEMHDDYDRMIVFTDEQSHDPVPNPKRLGYMVNVASAKNGVGYGPWVHIDGFSEAVVQFIREYESA